MYDGLELLKNIVATNSNLAYKAFPQNLIATTKLEEINMAFEDTATSRVREDMNLRLKTLAREYLHWNQFIRSTGGLLKGYASDSFGRSGGQKKPFHLDTWIKETFGFRGGELMAEPEIVKARWAEQVKTIAKMCPSLTTLNISIQPSILLDDADAYEVWSPLASQISTGVPGFVPCLRDLSIYNSCWSDVSGLLKVAGDKLERLNLMLRREIKYKISDSTSMDQINLVPHLCRRLRTLHLGYTHGTGIGNINDFKYVSVCIWVGVRGTC